MKENVTAKLKRENVGLREQLIHALRRIKDLENELSQAKQRVRDLSFHQHISTEPKT